jgi:hypothetical protein
VERIAVEHPRRHTPRPFHDDVIGELVSRLHETLENTSTPLAASRRPDQHERMRRIVVLTVVLSLTLAAGALGCQKRLQSEDYVEGELLIKYQAGVSNERMAEIHQSLGNRLAECWPSIRWCRVLLKEGVAVEEGIQQYRRFPEVENAEPNLRTRLGPPPQEPPTRLPQ